jgi:N-acetylmuramoyl-L-alanine amidase
MKTIFIDAGHGGNESGAVRHNIQEKDINLQVAIILKGLIQKDYKVIMLRETDCTISVNNRSQIANHYQIDLGISIHHNACNAKAKVFEIYHSVHAGVGKSFATYLATEYRNIGQLPARESGILTRKSDDGLDYYSVIRNTIAPWIISEFCYIDSDDYYKIDNYAKQYMEASAISRAVHQLFKK